MYHQKYWTPNSKYAINNGMCLTTGVYSSIKFVNDVVLCSVLTFGSCILYHLILVTALILARINRL